MKKNTSGVGLLVSYLVVDQHKNIVSFHNNILNNLNRLFKEPRIGISFEEIVPHEMAADLLASVESCFAFAPVSVQSYLESELVLFPVMADSSILYVVCLLLPEITLTSQVIPPDDYSRFTSHELRAPITNILSLSNSENYPNLMYDDGLKIKELLNRIYTQARKLNEVVVVLNSLINRTDIAADRVGFEKLAVEHIVLVDDDPIANMMHRIIVSRYKKDALVKDFDNSQKALEYIYLNKPDLVFLDINMPGIDGWEFLNILKEYPYSLNVIVVSSSIDPDERLKANSYDRVKNYIVKPLTFDKLKEVFS